MICFKHTTKQKYCPPEMYCAPPNLKTWLRACTRLHSSEKFLDFVHIYSNRRAKNPR